MRGGGEEDEKGRRSGVILARGGGEGRWEGPSDLTFVLFRLCFHGNDSEIMFSRYGFELLVLAANRYRRGS